MAQAYSKAALAWLSSVLSERFGQPLRLEARNDAYLYLSVEGSSLGIRFLSDPGTFTCNGSDLPCARWNGATQGWNMALNLPLPAPGAAALPEPLIVADAYGLTVAYDIPGLLYWMLTRREEHARTDVDLHGRFPAASSHAVRHGYLERPVVDEWLYIMKQAMQRVWPGMKQAAPEFFMRVSHDVDWPSRFGFSSLRQLSCMMASDLLHRRNLAQTISAPLIWLGTRQRLLRADPANTFDWIMDLSEHYRLRSAFYFICGRTNAAMDGHYEPEHPAVRELMRRIHARGHEIGLHPSYNTYKDSDALASEARRLRRICAQEGIDQREWGGRMHLLRWETPTTLRAWEQAAMSYDSSLGYADRPGFRCGTCFEYQAFDTLLDRALNLRIRPLIAMECTVMAPRYLGLGTGAAAREKFLQIKNACRAVAGCFTLLWHNSELETNAKRSLYASLLG